VTQPNAAPEALAAGTPPVVRPAVRLAGSPLAGMLWMALASVLFAAMNVLVRLAGARVPWQEVSAARMTVGAAVAVLVAWGRGSPLAIHDRKNSWGRSLFGTAAMLCGFYAMSAPAIALGDAVTLGATSPIFVALLSPLFLGEKSGRRVWAATVVAFAGLGLVAGPTFRIAGYLAFMATLGGFFSAVAMIWLRRLSSGSGAAKESPEAIVVHFSVTGAVVAVALALPHLQSTDLRGAIYLAGTGVLGGLAQLAMTRAYALERAARLGPLGYLGVVLTHAVSVVGLGETPSVATAAGSALIIAAGLSLGIAAMRDARRLRA
jgi:drug/metabolite transporter (DMT)-like permease